MSKPRDTSGNTTPQATDSTMPTEEIVQPIEQQPLVDSFTGTPIGDDTVNNPVIINR